MHVLRPKPKTSDAVTPSQPEGEGTQQDAAASPAQHEDGEEEEEEEEEEETKQAASGYDQQVAMLSDFLSKEEELYYYGAPGRVRHGDGCRRACGSDAQEDELRRDRQQVSRPERRRSVQRNTSKPDANRVCSTCRDSVATATSASTRTSKIPRRHRSRSRCSWSARSEYSKDLECGICLEKVLSKGERFGVLSNCRPPRSACHVLCDPVNRMTFTQARKQELVLRYKNNLAQIPCRHFDQGRGECPFGTSCFYAHRYPDGTEDLRVVRTAIDSVGQHDVLRKIRLEHFFENLEV
ncbi:hypothetical protein PINS_up021228 [Pythium insidiosum]|nr:hypothetical protein PINS_up021228 [Pythium insidiosum]